jgi:amino acid adenylation domain-containing protein
LDRLSSALAAHLAGLGVRPEVFVPLLFEKSRWTTVAMLGVMKAGGAFVLLDPSHPRARLQSICLAVSVDIAIASASQAAIAEQLVTRVVALGVEEMKLCEKRSDQMTPSVAPNNALYVVFTSGSTGVPKGAIVTHESYSTGALSYAPSLGLTHASRVFQFSSYAFDNSISDILTTLIVGGCVCVPSESARRGQLAIAIQNLKATVCFLTPSVARLLLPDEVQNLSTIILMGEAMTSRDVDQWADRLQLYNEYGPAECSVISTIQRIARKGNDPCNIGRGTGCVSWVVDQTNHDKLLPIGVIGELLIEGPIVGRGYLNNPEQTAATFIDPPAWLHTIRTAYPGNPGGDRVYKTGDLVQYTADGLLRFIGRKDTQVKLRGQRIELGDVEHHVRECFPGARDVVAEVVKPADDERPPMLIAFVWMDRNRDEGMDDILIPPTDVFRTAILTAETRLHDAVPVYMVPAVFLPLVAVPLTATGKTDRRRLRERAAALSQTQIATYSDPVTAKRQPSTTAQRILQQLWAQVLNLPSNAIGADDNFFRLGGDSITAMQLAGVARKNGLFLAVTDVFRYNTLATLASRPESPGTAHPEMVDWEEETALDPSLPRADPGHLCDSESISVALTGSTGFLGRELLRQLVTNTQVAYIHCLAIRPGRSLPPDLLSSTKIIPHSGDLSLPRLGLSETEASQIFSSVAAIIHNGADVSRLKSYSLLRGSNVDSTRQLLELSLLSTRHSSPGPRGTPHFHYISTAGVCHLLQARPFSEMSVASFPPPVDGVDGYTAAKWASERILERAAHTLGLQVVIHRPSQITGADVGDRDIWHNIWRWSQVIRAVPDLVAAGFRGAFDLISVEKCGTSIVCSVIDHLHRSADNPVDYVRETGDTAVPVETFGEFLGNEIGITNMPVLPFAEWVERAVEAGLDELVAVVLRQQAANA